VTVVAGGDRRKLASGNNVDQSRLRPHRLIRGRRLGSCCEARAVHTFRSAYHHLLAPAATQGITKAASGRSSTWGSVRGLLIGTGAGMNAIAAIAWSVGIALTGYLWARHLDTTDADAGGM